MNAPHSTAVLLLLASMAAVASSQEEATTAPERTTGPKTATKLGPATLGEAWQTALSTMREHKAPGLVFVLPEAGIGADPELAVATAARFHGKMLGDQIEPPKTTRELMLMQVQLLRLLPAERRPAGDERPQADVAVAFGLAVPVVATPEQAGAKPGETMILLEPTGERRQGFAVDLGDPDAVFAALREHLLDPESLDARRANVPPEFRDLGLRLFRLRKAATEGDEAARQEYLERIADLGARLYSAAPDLARQAHGSLMVDNHLRTALQTTIPLGTEVGASWDPCPPCGMMAVALPMRSTLKLLAQ